MWVILRDEIDDDKPEQNNMRTELLLKTTIVTWQSKRQQTNMPVKLIFITVWYWGLRWGAEEIIMYIYTIKLQKWHKYYESSAYVLCIIFLVIIHKILVNEHNRKEQLNLCLTEKKNIMVWNEMKVTKCSVSQNVFGWISITYCFIAS